MRISVPRLAASTVGLGVVAALAVTTPGATATTQAGVRSADRVQCTSAATRQGDFAAAARAAGVPRDLLLAVSYLESRWTTTPARRAPPEVTARCT